MATIKKVGTMLEEHPGGQQAGEEAGRLRDEAKVASWTIVNAVAFPYSWEVVDLSRVITGCYMSSNQTALADVLKKKLSVCVCRRVKLKADQLWLAASKIPLILPFFGVSHW